MKLIIKLLLVLTLFVFVLFACRQPDAQPEKRLENIQADRTLLGKLSVKGKLNLTTTGADGIEYSISMDDTIQGLPYRIPHLLLFQGDPLYLHSIVSLENTSRTGDDSINAIIGIVDNTGNVGDNRGNTNNVLRATSNEIGIQTTLAGDTTRGAYYGFTKNGIAFRRGDGIDFSRTYVLTNRKGLPGQVLTLNSSGDTAVWSNPAAASSVTQKYFAPGNGQSVSVVKSAYNIINPATSLSSLTIALPASPMDNDWFEITFTQVVRAINYTGAKVAGNALKTAISSNNYKKFVFRKADLTWY